MGLKKEWRNERTQESLPGNDNKNGAEGQVKQGGEC